MADPQSTTRSWRQRVLDADPDFMRKSLRPVVYEFSSGRKFLQPLDPYGGGRHFTLDETLLGDPIETLA